MKTNKFILSIAAMAGLLAGLSHAPANAALVTVSGTNVDFTYDDSLLGLYGTPTVSGNNLFFSPTQFKTNSLNGVGMTSESSTTYIDIQAHDGYSFDGLELTEIGDYKLLGQDSTVNISGAMLVIDKNNPPPAGPYSTAFINTTDSLNVHDGALHSWTASAQLDLTGGVWTDTTSLRVTLENLLDSYTATDSCSQLAAPSEKHKKSPREKKDKHGRKATASATTTSNNCGAQQAFIEKKFSGLNLAMTSTPIASVPLPPAFALLITGLLSLIGFGTRRQAE